MDDIAYIEEGPGRRRERRIWDVRPPRRGRARPVPRVRGRGVVRYRPEPRGEGRQRRQERQRNAIGEALAACAETGDWLVTLNLGPAYQHITLRHGRRRGNSKKQWSFWMNDNENATKRGAMKLKHGHQDRNKESPQVQLGRQNGSPSSCEGWWRNCEGWWWNCDGCGGRHWIRECTTTSTRMKERIWALKAGIGVANSTSGAKANRYSLRPQQDICAAWFGAHTVGRCPVPGRLHRNAAN